MIKSFWHKGLKELYVTRKCARIRPDLQERCYERLSVIDAARSLQALNLPGLHLHPLRGRPVRHSIRVNGPWRITFEWVAGDAWRLDLEQYH